MTERTFDPALDLAIERVIHAPVEKIWQAWTRPELLEKWWVPVPTQARIDVLEVRAGGGFVTRMSDDGATFVPHTDGNFLVVEENERLVFTNPISSTWRPASSDTRMPQTATITTNSASTRVGEP